MSQEQSQRDPVRYGDVFRVSGELANEPIAAQEAAAMQTVEAEVLGGVQSGGPAEVMRGAAVVNERIGGGVEPTETERDVRVTATTEYLPGARVVTESVDGQVLGQFFQTAGATAAAHTQITIGEALEAVARVCGDKPVDRADAAAIQEAVAVATGSTEMTPGGVAATAVSAASFNAEVDKEHDKIKLSYVLADATMKLPADRVATKEDAERVARAEQRNNPSLTTNPDGVASSVTTAAMLNEGGA